jgi:hypothetical protein
LQFWSILGFNPEISNFLDKYSIDTVLSILERTFCELQTAKRPWGDRVGVKVGVLKLVLKPAMAFLFRKETGILKQMRSKRDESCRAR